MIDRACPKCGERATPQSMPMVLTYNGETIGRYTKNYYVCLMKCCDKEFQTALQVMQETHEIDMLKLEAGIDTDS